MRIIGLLTSVAAITNELVIPEFKLCLIYDPRSMSSSALANLQVKLLSVIAAESSHVALLSIPVSDDPSAQFARLPEEAKNGDFPKAILTINAAELRLSRATRGVFKIASVPQLGQKMLSLIRRVWRVIHDNKDGIGDSLQALDNILPEEKSNMIKPESYEALNGQIEWVKTKVGGLVDSVKAVLIRLSATKPLSARKKQLSTRLMT